MKDIRINDILCLYYPAIAPFIHLVAAFYQLPLFLLTLVRHCHTCCESQKGQKEGGDAASSAGNQSADPCLLCCWYMQQTYCSLPPGFGLSYWWRVCLNVLQLFKEVNLHSELQRRNDTKTKIIVLLLRDSTLAFLWRSIFNRCHAQTVGCKQV